MAPSGFPEPEQPRANHGAAGISLTTSNPISAHPCFRRPQQPLLRSQPVLTSCWRWEQHRAAAGEGGGRLPPSPCHSMLCYEGWEGAGQRRGRGPCSKWRSDQDKQKTAGTERGVSSQTLKKVTGIVGRGLGAGPQPEATAADMSDCMGGPAAMGHAQWPRTPPQLGSEH